MSVVDDVKARLDLIDVVSGYVSLHKAGRNYKALCPFHQEKTPSFIVFPDTQTWRCFGACGEGGDVFGFVMKAEGWNFGEALRELAKRAGVELTPYTPQQEQQQTENERLRGLLNEAAHFFHEQLRESPAAQIARDYVIQRHLNEATAETFMLGYAPDDWRQALQHLQMLGYTQDEIVEAGVAIRNEEKDSVYDRFRHRLMIPIRDSRGSTVGFGARGLDKDAVPKYLNSPQGPLFDKSRLLFGLDMARRAIRETETVIVVEGYMDVMQAHQAGFSNVVAQMGTALTEEQLRQLDRYATRLILALDPDAAGINATMRGLNVAQQTLDAERTVTFDPRGMMRYTGMLNMDIRVIRLPEGQDPDDLIRDNPAAWVTLVEQAIPVADYVIQQGTAHLNSQSSYQEREQVARVLLPILTATESDIQRNGNIQTLARRVHIDERTLIQWMQHRQAAAVRRTPTIREQQRLADRPTRPDPGSGPPGQSALREGFFLRMLIDQPQRLYAANRKLRELRGEDETLMEVLAPLNREDFSRADFQAIFQALKDALYQEELDAIDYLYSHLSPELVAALQDLRVTPEEIFQHALPRSLKTEFQSILRDQARINTLPEPDLNLFVEEALGLRLRRLERALNELYFLQQEANDLTDQYYRNTVDVYTRARQLTALALREMRSLYRET
jgi:DNA primase